MTWRDVVCARMRTPFSRLRRKRAELNIIKDLIKYDLLACQPLKRRITRPLGIVTVTMPTEQMED